jgi:hypothetical protein
MIPDRMTLDDQRRHTRALVVQRIEKIRQWPHELTDPDLGYDPKHVPSVMAACNDNEALATFVIAFVGDWFKNNRSVEALKVAS